MILGNRAGTWHRLVVRRAEKAASDLNCVLTKDRCERLRYDVASGGDAASLDVLRAQDIVGWLAVENDWEDLSERQGVAVMPDAVPDTAGELRETRFFVNAFAREDTSAWEDHDDDACDE